jgi:hypothetical protein
MAPQVRTATQHAFDHPEYRTLVGVDIEGYARIDRTDLLRVAFRRQLSSWCADLLAEAGAVRDDYHQHSTGDGYLFSIDPRLPRTILLTGLIGGLRHRLLCFNRGKPAPKRMRVRLALHGGDVLRDPDPLEGSATVLTCRLLDAEILRACLRVTRQPLVTITSPVIYESIIRQDYPGIAAASWHRVVARIKEGRQEAWIHVPGDPTAARRAEALLGK